MNGFLFKSGKMYKILYTIMISYKLTTNNGFRENSESYVTTDSILYVLFYVYVDLRSTGVFFRWIFN
jgi:hypothetical protein